MAKIKKMGLITHENRTEVATDIWLTPPSIIQALGEFDLDPCSPLNRPWDTAKNHYTIHDDGLKSDWFGHVWLNPPYEKKVIGQFMDKMYQHYNGIALVFGRTDNKLWHEKIFTKASSLLFLQGRISFLNPDGSKSRNMSGAPSVLIGYGNKNDHYLSICNLKGKFIKL